MFRFKQFKIDDSRSSMKVGTDSVILGAWAEPGGCKSILDIGTGCGLLALMMARKSEALIDAIDIDENSVAQAAENFAQSPWSDRLKAHHASLETFSSRTGRKFDLIITNPPYFSGSLKSPEEGKTRSRHTVSLSPQQLYSYSCNISLEHTVLYCIVPVHEEANHLKEAAGFGFTCIEKLYVKAVETKKPYITGLKFARTRECPLRQKVITIKNAENRFTDEYSRLTHDFYLYF